ncbi:MAG: hypothetical protein KDC44_20275 [Phaeodactylibacter sp.]|nr:hypothetical protein [Phaeodactylibacter sp.]
MTPDRSHIDEQELFERLQTILLQEDRKAIEELRRDLDEVERLRKRVEPLIEAELTEFKQAFPNEYRAAVEKIITQKLKTSQKEMLDVIYPVLGRMIRKYIQLQFQQFREGIEQQIRKQLSTGLLGRMRYTLFGLSKKEKAALILSQHPSAIEELYVVEQHSGILIGSASRGTIVDVEMIAGMLTAIKAFVQDAFQQGEQEIELIQYETYSLIIQNHFSYYVAAAVGGPLSTDQNREIRQKIAFFAEHELPACLNQAPMDQNRLIKQKLETFFFKNGSTIELKSPP